MAHPYLYLLCVGHCGEDELAQPSASREKWLGLLSHMDMWILNIICPCTIPRCKSVTLLKSNIPVWSYGLHYKEKNDKIWTTRFYKNSEINMVFSKFSKYFVHHLKFFFYRFFQKMQYECMYFYWFFSKYLV